MPELRFDAERPATVWSEDGYRLSLCYSDDRLHARSSWLDSRARRVRRLFPGRRVGFTDSATVGSSTIRNSRWRFLVRPKLLLFEREGMLTCLIIVD